MSDIAGAQPDMDLLAAEYVLGTLDATERAAFERRVRDDAAARAAVAGWESRFAGLAERLDPVVPPADLWPRIERATALSGSRRPASTVVDGGALSAASPRLMASRARWRAAALSFGALAAALAVFVIAGLSQPRIAPVAQGERYIAAVNRGGDKPALIVRVDLATHQILVMPVAADPPAGRSLELWYIGDGEPPRPMGLVDKTTATLGMPAGAAGAGATVAVSVEPPGGSKTGAPTGPVVYSGKLIKE